MVQAPQSRTSDSGCLGDRVDRVSATVWLDHCPGAGARVHPGRVCIHPELYLHWTLPDRGGRLIGPS